MESRKKRKSGDAGAGSSEEEEEREKGENGEDDEFDYMVDDDCKESQGTVGKKGVDGSRSGKGWIRFASNFLTSLNLFSGFLAVFFAFEGKIMFSFYLIILGLIFDMADGRVARALNISSRFGLEFDSLADIVTFGLAPSAIIYNGIFKDWDFGKIFAFVPTLAVAIRLARYNVYSTSEDREYFQGLSSPMGAFTIVSVLMIMKSYELFSSVLAEVLFVLSIFGVAVLQVSSLRFRSFKNVRMSAKLFPYLLFLPPFFLWLAIFKRNLFFFIVIAINLFYIIYNILVENIFVRGERGERRKGRGKKRPKKYEELRENGKFRWEER